MTGMKLIAAVAALASLAAVAARARRRPTPQWRTGATGNGPASRSICYQPPA